MAEMLRVQKTHVEASNVEGIKAQSSTVVASNLGIEAYRKSETEKIGRLERFASRVKAGIHHISEIKRSQVITVVVASTAIAISGALLAGIAGESVAEAVVTWHLGTTALGNLYENIIITIGAVAGAVAGAGLAIDAGKKKLKFEPN